jgi:hypothetical protein
MPETSPTIQDEAGVTRTPTGTIQDQSTSIPPSQPRELPKAEPLKAEATTTTQSSEKPPEKSDGKSTQSLINEKSTEKGAPEAYSDFTVPEGFALDGEVAKEAGTLFKGLDLTQTQAQSLVDFYVKQTKEAFEAPFNAYMDKRQEWRNQINADSEIGGSKLNGVKVSIGKLIDSFGNAKIAEGFRDAMDYTGAGDNPDVVRGLYELSKRLTEGHAVRGNGPSTEGQRPGGAAQPGAAAAMYPHLPSSNR